RHRLHGYYDHNPNNSSNNRHNRPDLKHTIATVPPPSPLDKTEYLLQCSRPNYGTSLLNLNTMQPETPHQNVPDDGVRRYIKVLGCYLKPILKRLEFLFLQAHGYWPVS